MNSITIVPAEGDSSSDCVYRMAHRLAQDSMLSRVKI
eukprot:COSAG02_NODE_5685_length_4128_cov_30.387441_2_plen_37_part_00